MFWKVSSPFCWSSGDQLELPAHAQTWGGKLSGREGRSGEEWEEKLGRRREGGGEGGRRRRGLERAGCWIGARETPLLPPRTKGEGSFWYHFTQWVTATLLDRGPLNGGRRGLEPSLGPSGWLWVGLPRGCRGRQRGSGCNYNGEAPLPAPQALSPPLVQWEIRIAHNGPMGSQASFGLVEPSWAFTQRRVSRRFACVRDVKLRSCKARCKAPLAAKLPTHHIQRQCSHNTAPEPKSSSKKSWLRSIIWQLLWSFLILTKKFKAYDISFLV